MRAPLIATLLVLSLLACSSPAVAGGWAMVRLDTSPGEVVVGVPWKIGFMVRQHDVTPTNDVEPVVTARHQATGDVITATAQQAGPVGHFVAELTFPQAGAWKWEIRPAPFAETAFATLMVSDHAGAGEISYPASLSDGTCATPDDDVVPLHEITIASNALTSAPPPVAVGVSTIDAHLAELVDSQHTIRVDGPGQETATLACADVVAAAGQTEDEIILGLHGATDAANVGVAVLREVTGGTEVSLYLLPDRLQNDRTTAASQSVSVEIVEDMLFTPSTIEVTPGTTVTWTNDSEVAHTVTGDTLTVDDSGIIEPGQTFAYTFTEPGPYAYHCSPHPYMTGVVVVS